MTLAVVSDTGLLIALARVGRLDLLRRLYGQIVIPSAVHDELALDSDRPGAKALAIYRLSPRLIAGVPTKANE